MTSKQLLLIVLVAHLVCVKANGTNKKLEAGTDAVVDTFSNKMALAAMQPGGLTPDKLGATATQALREVKGQMKDLKRLDPKSEKVPDMIANKLATRMEGVLQLTGMSRGDIQVNTAKAKGLIKQKVKEYQDAN